MKKVLLLLLVGLLMAPTEMFADKYNSKKVLLPPHNPKAPIEYFISLYLDEDTGDLAITPNYAITGLNISIVDNGVTYLNTTVSLSAGQSYTDCLDFLDEGTYILTLTDSDNNVIDQYIITVEDD